VGRDRSWRLEWARDKNCISRSSEPPGFVSSRAERNRQTAWSALSWPRWMIAVGLGTVGLAGPALAQQQLPASVAPGQLENRFQPPPEPRATDEPEIRPTLEPEKPPSGAEQVRFPLMHVTVAGSTVFSENDFLPLYSDLIGKEVTLKQIYDIASAITAKYGNAGYALSIALVPAQRIRGGAVTIQVIEGYVDNVTIKTDDGRDISTPQLKAYGEKITLSRPLKQSDLERYVLLANDLPGVTARSVLEPSDRPGASHLTIFVNQKPVEGSVGFDNRGTQYSGPFEASLAASLNDVFGWSDRTSLRFINTTPFSELHYYEINHQEMIGSEGAHINLLGLASESRPGSSLGASQILTTNYTGSAQIYDPLIRSRAENLTLGGKFDFEQLDSTSFGVPQSADSLRIIRANATFDFVDTLLPRSAINLATVELSQALNILGATGGASANPSRPGMSSSFTKVVAEVSRSQSLTDSFRLLTAARGQYAFAILPTSEEFGFGGPQYGRGYDPSEIIGDRGVSAKMELQYLQSDCLKGIVQNCQFYGFADTGWVWNMAPLGSDPQNQNATSVGVGMRWSLGKHLVGNVEIAVPLTILDSQQGTPGTRAFFNLVAPF
jgi:hemolysin activation/secretion protein